MVKCFRLFDLLLSLVPDIIVPLLHSSVKGRLLEINAIDTFTFWIRHAKCSPT